MMVVRDAPKASDLCTNRYLPDEIARTEASKRLDQGPGCWSSRQPTGARRCTKECAYKPLAEIRITEDELKAFGALWATDFGVILDAEELQDRATRFVRLAHAVAWSEAHLL